MANVESSGTGSAAGAVGWCRLLTGMALLLLFLGFIFFLMSLLPLATWRERWSRRQFIAAPANWDLAGVAVGNNCCTAVCRDPATIAYLGLRLRHIVRDDPLYTRYAGVSCRAILTFTSGDSFSVRATLGSAGLELYTGYGFIGPPRAYAVRFKGPVPAPWVAMVKFVGNDNSRGTRYFR